MNSQTKRESHPLSNGGRLVTRNGSGVFYLEICTNGVQQRKSLGTSDLVEAIKLGEKEIERFLAASSDRLIPGNKPLSELAEEWFTRLIDLRKAQGTVDTYRFDLQTFVTWTGDQIRGQEPRLAQVTPDLMQRYVIKRSQTVSEKTHRLVSPNSVNRELRTLSSFLAYCVESGYVQTNAALAVKKLETEETEKVTPDAEAVEEIAGKIDDPLIHDVFVGLANTGCRISELISRDWNDFDRKRGILKIGPQPEIGFRPKTRRIREVPVNDVMRQLFMRRKNMEQNEKWIFATQSKTVPHRTYLTHRIGRYSKLAGHPGVTPHGLRRFWAEANAETLSPYQLSKVMGNSVKVAERHYVRNVRVGTWTPRAIGGDSKGIG